MLLPIGHLTKAEVKAIAAERLPGLRVLTKHESMGICFIGKRDMRDFLEDYITLTPGRYAVLWVAAGVPPFNNHTVSHVQVHRPGHRQGSGHARRI